LVFKKRLRFPKPDRPSHALLVKEPNLLNGNPHRELHWIRHTHLDRWQHDLLYSYVANKEGSLR
jgi:hypothetical protein